MINYRYTNLYLGYIRYVNKGRASEKKKIPDFYGFEVQTILPPIHHSQRVKIYTYWELFQVERR